MFSIHLTVLSFWEKTKTFEWRIWKTAWNCLFSKRKGTRTDDGKRNEKKHTLRSDLISYSRKSVVPTKPSDRKKKQKVHWSHGQNVIINVKSWFVIGYNILEKECNHCTYFAHLLYYRILWVCCSLSLSILGTENTVHIDLTLLFSQLLPPLPLINYWTTPIILVILIWFNYTEIIEWKMFVLFTVTRVKSDILF